MSMPIWYDDSDTDRFLYRAAENPRRFTTGRLPNGLWPRSKYLAFRHYNPHKANTRRGRGGR